MTVLINDNSFEKEDIMATLIIAYVKAAVHQVSGYDIINHMVWLGYKPHQAAGGIGAAIKSGGIRIARTLVVGGRKTNYFV